MRLDPRWTIVALAALTATAPLHAQRSEGITASIGLAYGRLSTSLTDNADDHVSGAEGAASGSILLGWSFNAQWRAALQYDQVDATNFLVSQLGAGTDVVLTFYTASLSFYPGARSNFWIRANAGLGRMKINRPTGNGSAQGFAAGLGLGYDWRLGKTPFVAVPYASYLSLLDTGDFGGGFTGSATHGRAGLLEVGVALGFGN
jgi:hypothetical protein